MAARTVKGGSAAVVAGLGLAMLLEFVGLGLPYAEGPSPISLVPAGIAIATAILTRQVVPALLFGVVVGAGLVEGTVVGAFFAGLDRIVAALADADKAKIVIFTLSMGGMVGALAASGGAAGLASLLSRRARSRRGFGLATGGLGLLFFFDDYASSLMVGTTMRPVADRLRVSREKLAYLVDSTSAPVASLALVSTWVGYEVGVLQEALTAAGIDRGGYEVFLAGLPARFYPWLALFMVFWVSWTGRDFGPMARAEARAREGAVSAPDAQPLMDVEAEAVMASGSRPRVSAGLAPVLALVITVVGVLAWTGWQSADGAALQAASEQGLLAIVGLVLGEAASYDALVYGSGVGIGVAVLWGTSQGAFGLGQGTEAVIRGAKATAPAVVVLLLAWALGTVMESLQAGPYLAGTLGPHLPAWSLPTVVFLVSALLALATGTSWGTMAIVFPIVTPIVASHAGTPGFEAALLGSTASVLAGAVFGDHCSPISDTTVLSSVACACDHADHVRTQAPYATLVAGVSVLFGTLPYGLGLGPWPGMVLGTGALILAVRFQSGAGGRFSD
ncbi:MAG: Na+/H+ antiporter NhaC family protein [Myxococcota bacterium]